MTKDLLGKHHDFINPENICKLSNLRNLFVEYTSSARSSDEFNRGINDDSMPKAEEATIIVEGISEEAFDRFGSKHHILSFSEFSVSYFGFLTLLRSMSIQMIQSLGLQIRVAKLFQ